jgi:hypothetical protein
MGGDGTRLGVVPRVWPMSWGLLGSQWGDSCTHHESRGQQRSPTMRRPAEQEAFASVLLPRSELIFRRGETRCAVLPTAVSRHS